MKYVYLFNEPKEKTATEKIGTNGSYLSNIANLGLNVSNGFVITTDVCNEYYENNRQINQNIKEQITEYIHKLEQLTKKSFGGIHNPLLLSVRCSLKNEVPGIMNSISNVGLTDDIVQNLSKDTNDFIWIWECYFNFINDYAKCIMNVDLETYKYIKDVLNDKKITLSIEELEMLLSKLKKEYKVKTKMDFPSDSEEQLYSIINACYESWNNERANIYRRDMDMPFNEGIAVCVQAMVNGNKNEKSGIGTIFTRDPITGATKDEFTDEKYFVGKFSKQSIENNYDVNMDYINKDSILAVEFPDAYKELKAISKILEKIYQDMFEMDFVIEDSKLFITNVCKGKRTAKAALKIKCDIFDEYILNKKDESLEDKEIKVSFDLNFGGFKQREIGPLYKAEKKENPALKKLRKKDYKK